MEKLNVTGEVYALQTHFGTLYFNKSTEVYNCVQPSPHPLAVHLVLHLSTNKLNEIFLTVGCYEYSKL